MISPRISRLSRVINCSDGSVSTLHDKELGKLSPDLRHIARAEESENALPNGHQKKQIIAAGRR